MLTLPLVSLLAFSRFARADDSDNSGDDASANQDLKQNSANCSCYAIGSGSHNSSEYFSYHRFYDFRSLATSADQYTVPDVVSNDEDQGTEPVAADDAGYFNGTQFMNDWDIQSWTSNATADFPVRMVNTAQNVYISIDSEYPTYLTMRVARLADFSSASELANNQANMLHASVRMWARVVGASGACAGFFTYYDDDNESDIEILTQYGPNEYQYTNQPSVDKGGDEIEAASINVTMPASDGAGEDWTQWHEHRIDWLPHRVNWYLDGKMVATNTYSVPRKPSALYLNMWSNGGSWSGNMTEGDAAEFHVQWVQMVFNTSGPRAGPDADSKRKRRSHKAAQGCSTICRVDGVEAVGYPEVAYVSTGGAASVVCRHGAVWLVVAAVGALLAWA
ncbi:concanavalin A-like lectin/glucanase domain-containing protein [Phyllosticta citribraziliensis]|uniref:Concanavalin A-like lectin/glucanase domain-containing protein n=1 Tax=Phyllosticta citribraziliensis TaxID=989973 RepID=A0ABR1LMH2_9PEZI